MHTENILSEEVCQVSCKCPIAHRDLHAHLGQGRRRDLHKDWLRPLPPGIGLLTKRAPCMPGTSRQRVYLGTSSSAVKHATEAKKSHSSGCLPGQATHGRRLIATLLKAKLASDVLLQMASRLTTEHRKRAESWGSNGLKFEIDSWEMGFVCPAQDFWFRI